MAENQFKFGRGIIPEGRDPTIIRRNFQSLGLLVAQLEKMIPFLSAEASASALMVKEDATTRTLVDSGVSIDPATQAMTGIGAITAGGIVTFDGTFAGTGFLDEDDMASDADDKVASQQSVKAYVDTVRNDGPELVFFALAEVLVVA